MTSKKALEAKLKADWDALQAKYASGPKFTSKNKNHRTPIKEVATKLTKVFTEPVRKVDTKGHSVPMGAGGTLPYDPDLEAAKKGLAWRVGPLFNKGGNQYMTDGDLADLQRGTNRKHT